MRGDEVRVVAAFCAWLTDQGWDVRTEVDHVDVLATRGDETLYAEAKGRTSDASLDADFMYGQLLRRMKADEPTTRYGAVVPEGKAVWSAQRVPAWIRDRLRIDIYAVDESDAVRLVSRGGRD